MSNNLISKNLISMSTMNVDALCKGNIAITWNNGSAQLWLRISEVDGTKLTGLDLPVLMLDYVSRAKDIREADRIFMEIRGGFHMEHLHNEELNYNTTDIRAGRGLLRYNITLRSAKRENSDVVIEIRQHEDRYIITKIKNRVEVQHVPDYGHRSVRAKVVNHKGVTKTWIVVNPVNSRLALV